MITKGDDFMTLRLKDRFSIVKGLLYLTLGISCVYLIVTGRYLNYIAPRYELLLGISSVALILGGLATIIWAPSKYYKHNWKSIVPIIIPIMLLIVPPVLVPSTGVHGATRVNDDTNNFDFTNDAIGEVVTVNSESKEPGISKDKKEMEKICREMGMSMTTAFTIFATKVTKEKRIPFEITADPFYSESNMKYLEKVIADIESGKAKLVEHDLIEE